MTAEFDYHLAMRERPVRCWIRSIMLGMMLGLLLPPPIQAARSEQATVGGRPLMGGDRVRITVDEDPSLSGVYAIAGDGTIDFGYSGRIRIADISAEGAADLIEGRLEEKYFKDATVTVDVAEFVEGDILILGEVNQPGTIAFSGDRILTVVEAIAMREGFTDNAAGTQVRILRWKPGGSMERETIVVDVQTMFETLDFSRDQYLRPRDMVIIPTLGEGQGSGEFLALGSVGSSGFHPYSEGLDVMRMLSRVGGLGRDAQMASAKILRPDGSGGYIPVAIDLSRLLGAADMSQNIAIQPGDIFFVPTASLASSGRVYLLGEVAQKGAINLPSDRDATLAKTILRAGGFTKYANDGKVEIRRTGPDGSEQRLTVDVGRILTHGDFDEDVPLRDGDVIIVHEGIFSF